MNVKAGLGFRGNARRAPQEGRQVVAEPAEARLGPVVRSGLARRAAARLGNGGAGRAGEGQHFGIMGFVMRLLAGFMASFLPRRPIVATRSAVALLGIARGPLMAPLGAPMLPAPGTAAVRRLGGDAVNRKRRDRAADQSLDCGDVLAVLGARQHEGAALPPGPSGAPDPMHIILGMVGHIEAENV